MKATDLMCGDLILVNERPTRVYGVMERMGRVYDTMTNDISLKRCEPIPLTEEILEKNGFGYVKRDGDALIHYYPGVPQFCTDMDLHIGTDKKGHYWLNYRANDIYGIRSVHELQHAFRLCKIEQEIIL